MGESLETECSMEDELENIFQENIKIQKSYRNDMIKIQLEVKKDNIIELTAIEAKALYTELKEMFEGPQNPTIPYYTQPWYSGTPRNFPSDLLKNNQI